MYFDAVLDGYNRPLFNGTPEECMYWLQERPSIHDKLTVCVGLTMKMLTVAEYLASMSV